MNKFLIDLFKLSKIHNKVNFVCRFCKY
jgi:hypothetical protein